MKTPPVALLLMLLAVARTAVATEVDDTHRGGPQPLLVVAADVSATVAWKVVQRNTPDGGPVPLRLYYRLDETGRLEASVFRSDTGEVLPGQDYADNQWPLAASAGQTVDVAIESVAAGGNYDIRLRLVRDSDNSIATVAIIGKIAVGDVFLAGGQSNMAGYSESLTGAEAPIPQVHLFGNDYVWKPGSEPMDDGTGQIDAVSLDFPLHSVMLRFAKDVYAATGVPVGVIPGPLGGSSLATQWQRDDLDPANRATLYGSLLFRAQVQNYAAPPAGFLWFQGESDAGSTSPDYYRGLLQALIADYRGDLADPELDFIVAQLGTYTFAWLPGWLAVQEGQRLVARSDAHVALVTAVDQPTHDSIHYTTAGYKEIGARFAAAARQTVYGQPVDALTELVSASVGADNRSIVLTYDGPVAGGGPGLYRVAHGAGQVAVESASIAGPTVTLALGTELIGAPSITYGWSRFASAPWLTDSSWRAVPVFRFVTAD